jgi:hypothetical protein
MAIYPKLRCPKCGRRVAPFWMDLDSVSAMTYGAGEATAYLLAIGLLAAGALVPEWARVPLAVTAVLVVMPAVYWRLISRGRFYCAKCDTVLPRSRVYPREETEN